ncbi:MAG: hypothetical protein O3A51_13075, partial [Verrucomicrobia bacterium]|nr:hypothetical protein [Verrucomicrobiota bacterium]
IPICCDGVDSDGDEMPDVWESRHDLNPADGGDKLGDADEDGFQNYAEARAGTNPRDASSRLALVDLDYVSVVDGYRLWWTSQANHRYAIARSTNLMDGFEPLVDNLAATPPTNSYTDIVGATNAVHYYRVSVE